MLRKTLIGAAMAASVLGGIGLGAVPAAADSITFGVGPNGARIGVSDDRYDRYDRYDRPQHRRVYVRDRYDRGDCEEVRVRERTPYGTRTVIRERCY